MFNKEKPVKLTINKETCTNCGSCVAICSGDYLLSVDNTIKANDNAPFGCIQCGHCMMSCPNKSIDITGEGVSQDNLVPLNENLPGFDEIYSLFTKRRSSRKFKKQEIPKEIIDKIIKAASTAPISIPPSEVKILVINGTEKVQDFADDIVKESEKILKFMNPFMLKFFRPVIGKVNYKFFNEFIIPLFKTTIDERKKGNDILFYNAPAAIVFYGSELCGKEDQILAATHAAIAAEALGLGTCIIGSVPPIVEKSKGLKKKYGMEINEKPAIAFILGYSDVSFNYGIKRQFKDINFY